eukprot:Clim_evm25s99 gene=Clim_evmTU25s99
MAARVLNGLCALRRTTVVAHRPGLTAAGMITIATATTCSRSYSSSGGNGHKVLILGPPGSGKGTVSQWMIDDYGFIYTATGNILRNHVAKQTEIGQKVANFMKSGKLVPDDLILDIFRDEFASHEGGDQAHWLLDGFPRTPVQAKDFEDHHRISLAINMCVPDEEIVERTAGRLVHLASGRTYHRSYNPPRVEGKDDITGEDLIVREDDKLEVVKKRLQLYHEASEPLLAHFEELGTLQNMRGSTSDEIYGLVRVILKEKLGMSTDTDASERVKKHK